MSIILILFILMAFCIFFMFPFIESFFIFQPGKLEKNYDFKLDNSMIEEITIDLNKNISINCLYFKNPNADTLIIHSHGNAGNILNRIPFALKLLEFTSVLLYDYQGYGKSTGKPSEQGLYNNIMAVWKHMVYSKQINPNKIILYGESLGCSVAAYMGAKLCKKQNLKPKSIILQSGFSSLREVALDLFPSWLLIFLFSEFNSSKYLTKIKNKIPILIAHSDTDEVINIKHAYALIKANGSELINFHKLEGGHNTPNIDDDFIKKLKQHI